MKHLREQEMSIYVYVFQGIFNNKKGNKFDSNDLIDWIAKDGEAHSMAKCDVDYI